MNVIGMLIDLILIALLALWIAFEVRRGLVLTLIDLARVVALIVLVPLAGLLAEFLVPHWLFPKMQSHDWIHWILAIALFLTGVVAIIWRVRLRRDVPAWSRTGPARIGAGVVGAGFGLLTFAILILVTGGIHVLKPSFSRSRVIRGVLRLPLVYDLRADVLDANLPVWGKRIFEGELPVPFERSFCGAKVLHQSGEPGDLLALRVKRAIEIYRFSEGSWTLMNSLKLQDTTFDHRDFGDQRWTTGDLDSDGNDDIVAADDSGLQLFRWSGAGYVERFEPAPFPSQMLAIQDLDADGRNELLLVSKSLPVKEHHYAKYAAVARLSRGALELISNGSDHPEWLGESLFSHAPDLPIAADLKGLGVPQLLLRTYGWGEEISYRAFRWQGARLERVGDFVLASDRLVPAEPKSRPRLNLLEPGLPRGRFFAEGFVPLDRSEPGSFALNASYFARTSRTMVCELRGRRVHPRGVIAPFEGSWVQRMLWIDPDGKGAGVLGIVPGRSVDHEGRSQRDFDNWSPDSQPRARFVFDREESRHTDAAVSHRPARQ